MKARTRPVLVLAAFLLAVPSAAFAEDGWTPRASYPYDVVTGPPSAPVTVYEYASLTCPHCARFQSEELPAFAARWIDSGKARLVLRQVPLDRSALAGALALACIPEASRDEAVSALFASVPQWAPKQDLAPVLGSVLGRDADFVSIIRCMASEETARAVMEPSAEASGKGLRVTPTFVVAGKVIEGFVAAGELGAAVDDALADEFSR